MGEDETAAQIIERVEGRKKRAVELYQTDHRFRAQAQTAVSQAMAEYGRIDPDHAERSAHDIALKAVVTVMTMILDDDAELKFTRLERDRYRDQILDLTKLSPGIPIYASRDATDDVLGKQ